MSDRENREKAIQKELKNLKKNNAALISQVQEKEKANDELKENIAKLETQNEEAIAIAKHEAKLKLDEKLKEAEDIHKAELQEKIQNGSQNWQNK